MVSKWRLMSFRVLLLSYEVCKHHKKYIQRTWEARLHVSSGDTESAAASVLHLSELSRLSVGRITINKDWERHLEGLNSSGCNLGVRRCSSSPSASWCCHLWLKHLHSHSDSCWSNKCRVLIHFPWVTGAEAGAPIIIIINSHNNNKRKITNYTE